MNPQPEQQAAALQPGPPPAICLRCRGHLHAVLPLQQEHVIAPDCAWRATGATRPRAKSDKNRIQTNFRACTEALKPPPRKNAGMDAKRLIWNGHECAHYTRERAHYWKSGKGIVYESGGGRWNEFENAGVAARSRKSETTRGELPVRIANALAGEVTNSGEKTGEAARQSPEQPPGLLRDGPPVSCEGCWQHFPLPCARRQHFIVHCEPAAMSPIAGTRAN